ncbi:hypothetical protein PoB_006332800 [Plakobranchus ocellatus]|uniref:Uncharacterized protein n=1 Tax=Plakobranchus ocellatus TaxID=259542 RepID=A0AAV4CY54_9GAST|nr:hypothetical protein PoB_006332800 [Plakobranchus ocellatus]
MILDSLAQALDYDEVKKTSMKRYDITEDRHRYRFRIGKPEEVAEMFIVRIKTYQNRWVELSDTKQTYEGLRNVFMQGQCMDAYPDDLYVYTGESVHYLESVGRKRICVINHEDQCKLVFDL